MSRILVTPRSLTASPHPVVEALSERGYQVVYSRPGRLPSEDELVRLLPGVVGWLAGVEPISPTVVAAASDLRVISRNGVGVDNLPLPALAKRGIAVRIASGANAFGVAELTVALMLAALRNVPLADGGIKRGEWPRKLGREIRGRAVGIVGCGSIGGEVARLVAALGAKPLVYDVASDFAATLATRLTARAVGLDELLAESDLITLHCPAAADGRPLLDAASFAAMRRDVVIVNTARASLVDQAALLAALNDGKAASYAVDVFAEEPPRDRGLANDPRVIATSHIGGYTEESVERATSIAVANLIEALEADRM